MKIKLTFFLLLASSLVFCQKNEIIGILGVVPNGPGAEVGEVYQLKYERYLSKAFSYQLGIRKHLETSCDIGFYHPDSKFIQKYYSSNKLDLTFLAIPVNKEKFKFKIGLGFDYGISRNAWAGESRIISQNTPNGERTIQYVNYEIITTGDLGMHFTLMGNYYFKNGLFLTGGATINKVFKEDEFSPWIFRQSPLFFNLGIGCQF